MGVQALLAVKEAMALVASKVGLVLAFIRAAWFTAADTFSGLGPLAALVAVVTGLADASSGDDSAYGAQLSVILGHFDAALFHLFESCEDW